MLDFFLMVSLGFLGSFGHCVGMCGPLSLAFTLPREPFPPQAAPNPSPESAPDRGLGSRGDRTSQSQSQSQTQTITQSQSQSQSPTQPQSPATPNPLHAVQFQILLNLGRILSYALVGAAIGWVGSVLLAGGQMAGVGSTLRRGMGLLTGGLLVWFGLVQVSPGVLPQVPLLNPMAQSSLHDRLGRIMGHLAQQSRLWTPIGLGLVWGLMPCGFLYAAQIKAAETGNWFQGALTMLAFGLGTAPTMVGVGLWAGLMSRDRRSQLFRLGGWVTLLIGVLTLTRTGETLMNYSGHGALFALALALVARPLNPWWAGLLQYRRALGVGGFVLAVAHCVQMLEHSWNWNWQAITFLLPQHQWAMAAGALSLLLMTPAALTSFNRAQQRLGRNWRRIHLLGVPAFLLAAIHALFLGSHYLGQLRVTWTNGLAIGALGLLVLGVFTLRSAWFSHHFGIRRSIAALNLPHASAVGSSASDSSPASSGPVGAPASTPGSPTVGPTTPHPSASEDCSGCKPMTPGSR